MHCSSNVGKRNSCCSIRGYGIFVGFIILGAIIWFFKLNQSLFYGINSRHAILPDIVWEAINFISYSRTFILPTILIIITYIWRREKILQVIGIIIGYYILFSVLKILFGEARPYIVLPQNSFFWINKFENAVTSAYKSFPSGHTGNMAVFVFTITALFSRKWLHILLYLLLLLTAVARICTGWHWPLDVIASGLFGYILVKISLRNTTPI